MAAGKLKLSGGAEALLEAETRYSLDSWRPEIRYDVTGFRGRLSVRHPNHAIIAGKTVAEWDLRLNQDTPLVVKVKLGAGESLLDLGSLTLRNLEVELGAGSLKLDLTGTPKKTMDVKIRGGVGHPAHRGVSLWQGGGAPGGAAERPAARRSRPVPALNGRTVADWRKGG